MALCPCGTKKEYSLCCGLFISGQENPATPELLMRSRYTAYTLSDMSYISQTMSGIAAQNFDPDNAKTWAGEVTWLGLKVINSNYHANKGFVEFIAHYLENEKKMKIHEISQFSLINNKWYYTKGIHKK